MLEELQQGIRDLEGYQNFLESEIQKKQERLQQVRTSLSQKITKAKELKNSLAPISRLPNEMLLVIFEELVSSPAPGNGKEMCAAMWVSHVSRRWRDVAVSSPRLWRHIWVGPQVGPRVLEAYISRGSGSFDVSFFDWRDRREFQRFDSALDKILPSSGQWRSLSISSMCDTNLSHLGTKLSNGGPLTILRHVSFRAFRPGQSYTIQFLKHNNPPVLKTLDAENFSLAGDLSTRMIQAFSKLTTLTLRRYSHDARSLRIMIDSGVFRSLLHSIPGLTTLALYGQPLRFRIDPRSDDESALVSMPQLQTLILHPGVLKPRYLQQTMSNIHAPSLRHFELVFPDSKVSGQNIVNLLFDSSTKRARFPLVSTVVLHNASNSSTALSFIDAFPYASHVKIGGVDVGFFLQALRARSYDPYDCTYPPFPYWHRLRRLTLRSTKPETLRVVREWITDELDRGHIPPTLIMERRDPIDSRDLALLYHCSRGYARIEIIDSSSP